MGIYPNYIWGLLF